MNGNFTKKATFVLCLLLSINSAQSMQYISAFIPKITEKVHTLTSQSPLVVPGCILMAGIGLAMTIKAGVTRYLTLGEIESLITPTITLSDDSPENKSISNWNITTEHFQTASQVKAHEQEVATALITACNSGQITVYKHDCVNEQQDQGLITWQDLLETIKKERLQLKKLKKKIEPLVSVSYKIFYKKVQIFGVHYNYERACQELAINDLNNITIELEGELNTLMLQNRSLVARLVAFFMLNPNYNKAHQLYWKIHTRLLRLNAINKAIARLLFKPTDLVAQPQAANNNDAARR